MNQVLRALSRKPFAVIGHRGAAGLAPENTMSSFLKAVEIGADLVELDVQVTLDGVAVALHDEDLRRVAGVDLNVRRSSYRDLSGISIGGEKIPTLEEILRIFAEKIGILIEIKIPGDEDVVIDVVKRSGAEEKVAVISFHEEVLASVKKRLPRIPCGIVYSKPPGKIVEAKRAGLEIVLPRYPLATQKAVDLAHRMGIRVVAWTVNDEEWIMELARRGVDGIASDYPDIAVRIRSSLRRNKDSPSEH